MSEWWTYTLSDFLLFSPRTFFRLFEIFNAAVWPAQIVALCLGLVILALLLRPGAPGARSILTILAVLWLFVAVAFLAHRYATINWAAVYFAWAFGAQAALLLWKGLSRNRIEDDVRVEPDSSGRSSRSGTALFAFALLVLPAIGPLLGREWKGIGIFGTTPDPTAIGTLGILLASRVRHRWALMIIPALWCAISGVTLLALKAPDAWIPPVAAAIAVWLAMRRRKPAKSRAPSF